MVSEQTKQIVILTKQKSYFEWQNSFVFQSDFQRFTFLPESYLRMSTAPPIRRKLLLIIIFRRKVISHSEVLKHGTGTPVTKIEHWFHNLLITHPWLFAYLHWSFTSGQSSYFCSIMDIDGYWSCVNENSDAWEWHFIPTIFFCICICATEPKSSTKGYVLDKHLGLDGNYFNEFVGFFQVDVTYIFTLFIN